MCYLPFSEQNTVIFAKLDSFMSYIVLQFRKRLQQSRKRVMYQPQDKTFTFSAEQLVKFVANVVIQVAQPQVCYANPNQDAIYKSVVEFLKLP